MGAYLVFCKHRRKIKTFLKVWMILSKDRETLEIVKGLKIHFRKNPTLEKVPQTPHMGHKRAALIQVEVKNT